MIRSNKVVFVGDLHLDSSTPSSRVDDYSDASLQKLEALKSLCLVKDIKLVILLGDVFNKNDQSNVYLNRVMKVFREFKNEGITVETIIGNHDIVFNRKDTIDRSPLQMLMTADLITHLTEEVLDTGSYPVGIYGSDYTDAVLPLSEMPGTPGTLNCLVLHRFYENSFGDTAVINAQDCVELGYNIYACGHDHLVYDIEKCHNFWVVRPGSFMRTNSLRSNLERDIYVDVIEFRGTKDMPQMISSREIIPCRPSSEVFSASVFMKGEENLINSALEDLHQRVGQLLQQMDVKDTGKHDVYQVLDSICSNPEVKQCVETYLSLKGYVRE